MNLLKRAKTYLIGPMEYANGRAWREDLTEKLSSMGIICYDPYKKPFVVDVDEGEDGHKKLRRLMEEGNYDEVSRVMKRIRGYDLALTDKSDFIIAYVNIETFTVGTWEELFWSNRMKKPLFLIVEGGKKKCPLWLFGTIPHKFIYDSVDDVVSMLKKIDSGEKEMDSERWRLLRLEFR